MTTIKLPPRCDRAAIQALVPDFVAAQSAGQFAIDASEVEQIGQAALQLLVAARKAGPGASIRPSAALRDAAQITGLSTVLFDGEA